MRLHRFLACYGLVLAATPAWAAETTATSVVAQTTSYRSLTIAADALPQAPAGKALTLTVNGVQTTIAPGTYTGDVVLAVTDDIPVQYHELPVHHFRTALYIEDGQLNPAKSVLSAAPGVSLGQGSASNIRITSKDERFNGIIVTGKGQYAVDHPIIDLTGNGGNDFAGFGAAITAKGDVELTLNRPVIRTQGAIRTAIFVGGHANVQVNDAEIEVLNGTLPKDYKFTVDVGRMMEVPWMLGLAGNVRATNLVDYGTVTYNRSHIRAQGWGAASTDDNVRVRMFVNDSLIETFESGYGCYSIGDSIDTFTRSVIRAADIGCIMAAEGSVTFTDGTLVHSGRYGVMMHSGMGGGTLTIDKGSEMHSAQTAIEVKGIGTTILVDNAKVSAGNGIILQGMENDDPFMKAMMSGHMPEGMGPPPPGMGGPPPGAGPKGPPPSPNIVATFRKTALSGDIYNGRTSQGGMKVAFENASITGVISTSTTAPALGQEPTRATYQEIGHVTNTVAPTTTANGLTVALDGQSSWVVTGKSYLTGLSLAPGASLAAPDARKVVLTINGKPVPIKPGTYSGKITVEPR